MIPNKPIVLKGKGLKEFEKYQRRTPTQKELDFVKKADKIYRSQHPLSLV